MDTKRNTPLRAVIWIYSSGVPQESKPADQERLCRETKQDFVVVDVLRGEGGRRAYRALNAHCRAQDFDVLVMRDWHRLAANPRTFRYWVRQVLGAGASLCAADDRDWIEGEGSDAKTA